MLQLFKSITSSRFCWFLLLLSGVALEACGLFFQYELSLNPCVNCVYERAFFLGFIVTGFLGAIAASFFIIRFICSLGFLASAIGGLTVAWEHYNAYHTVNTGFGSSCKLQTEFPSFLPLDEIAPFMFKATGLCSDKIDWSLLGYPMPDWILLTFGTASLIALFMFLSNFVRRKTNNFTNLYR